MEEGRKVNIAAFKRTMRSEEDIGMQWPAAGRSERGRAQDKLQSMLELNFTNEGTTS